MNLVIVRFCPDFSLSKKSFITVMKNKTQYTINDLMWIWQVGKTITPKSSWTPCLAPPPFLLVIKGMFCKRSACRCTLTRRSQMWRRSNWGLYTPPLPSLACALGCTLHFHRHQLPNSKCYFFGFMGFGPLQSQCQAYKVTIVTRWSPRSCDCRPLSTGGDYPKSLATHHGHHCKDVTPHPG